MLIQSVDVMQLTTWAESYFCNSEVLYASKGSMYTLESVCRNQIGSGCVSQVENNLNSNGTVQKTALKNDVMMGCSVLFRCEVIVPRVSFQPVSGVSGQGV